MAAGPAKFSEAEWQKLLAVMQRNTNDGRPGAADIPENAALISPPRPPTMPEVKDPQPVKVVEGHPTGSEKIVESVESLKTETKRGLAGVADSIKTAFLSLAAGLRNGSGDAQPVTPAVGSSTVAGSVPKPPLNPLAKGNARPVGMRPDTSQADKYVDGKKNQLEEFFKKSGKFIRGDEAGVQGLTKSGIAETAKNVIFDPDTIFGSYVNHKFAKRKAENSYADDQIEAARRRGETPKSRKEYREQGRKVNEARGEAKKVSDAIEKMRSDGYSRKDIEASGKIQALEKINEKIAGRGRVEEGLDEYGNPVEGVFWQTARRGLDPIQERRRDEDARKKAERRKKKEEEESRRKKSKRDDWEDVANERKAKPEEERFVYDWPARTDGSSDSLKAVRPESSKNSASETEAETERNRDEELEVFKKIEANTAPILDIHKLLLKKADENKESADTEEGGGSAMSAIGGAAAGWWGRAKGIVSKGKNFLSKGGRAAAAGTVLAGGFGAYEAYSGMSDADTDLAAGKITEDQANVKKGSAIGSGVAGAFGTAFGATVGSALGPLGTIAGGYIGHKIGSAVGDVAGEIGVAGYQGIRNLFGGPGEEEPKKKGWKHPDSVNGVPWDKLTPEQQQHSKDFSRSVKSRARKSRKELRASNRKLDEAGVPWTQEGDKMVRKGTFLGGDVVMPGKDLTSNQMAAVEMGTSMGNDYSPEIMGQYNKQKAARVAPVEPPSNEGLSKVKENKTEAPAQTINNMANVQNNSTKVVTPPVSPSNDDPTVLRYGASRYSPV